MMMSSVFDTHTFRLGASKYIISPLVAFSFVPRCKVEKLY